MTPSETLPLLSVIIPTFNSARFLGAAIESVRAQSYSNLEILVVDDASTDETGEVLAQFPDVRVFRQERRGGGVARNLGVSQARGELLAFLDADDLWEPQKLERQYAVWATHPQRESLIVGCLARQFFDACVPTSEQAKVLLPSKPQVAFVAGAILLSRALFQKIGDFQQQTLGDVVDWTLRARDQGVEQLLVPETLLHRRVHDRNTTRLSRDQRFNYLRSLKASLDRRRATGQL